jgi:prolyl oligopeptidase
MHIQDSEGGLINPISRKAGEPWLLLGLLLLCAGCSSSSSQEFRYPETHRGGVVDNYHGTRVPDFYRWLETLDSEATQAWVAEQNRLTEPYLEDLPARTYFVNRLRTLLETVTPGVIQKQGPYWVTRVRRPDGTRVFFVQDDIDAPKRVLLDPKVIFPDNDVVVEFVRISPNGRYAAYTVAPGGMDLMEIRFRDLVHDRDLPDRIPDIKFDGPFWTADSRGLIFWRYLKPGTAKNDGIDRESIVVHHTLGTPIEQDRVLDRARPEDVGSTTWSELSADGRFVVVVDDFGFKQQVSVLDLENPHEPSFDGPLVALNEERDSTNDFIGNVGSTLYLKTSRGASNSRVVAIELNDSMNWRTILPETEHLLEHALLVGGHIVAAYRRDVMSALEVYDLDGAKVRDVSLPAPGSAFWLSGTPESHTLTFTFDAYAHPPANYRHDVYTGETTRLAARDIGMELDDYVSRQVFYTSKDGTRVPMFITHRTDLALDGAAPTILHGYGASGAIIDPIFQDDWFAWIEAGGVLAVASVRGGGEYGEVWHQAGMLANKQNTFDDFISAAEYLIHEGYTGPGSLAISGHSNGGLLVGAVMTQRPELFAAAMPVAGVLDALRFPSLTAGPRWAKDMGDPTIPEQFKWLYDWSPLQHLRSGTCYPSTLIMTAANDDLVHPSQSYKFAAGLQAAQSCARPTLVRVYPSGGHNFIINSDHIQERADLLAFAARHTGLAVPVR